MLHHRYRTSSRRALIRSAIEFVREHRNYMIEKLGRADIDRIDIEDGAVPEMMIRLGLTYHVPYRTEMSAANSADFIVSCSVFEHIPAKTLETMFAEFSRILVPGGAMVHFIDFSDHYWQCDRSLSRCNFLQYEEWQWRLLSLNPRVITIACATQILRQCSDVTASRSPSSIA